MPHIISIVGKAESGKTTLIEKLIPELKKGGYKVGVIKHAHRGFDMDKKGKDTYRHKKAGADAVLVSSPGKIAMVKDEPGESLDNITKYLKDMDLVITEGFKKESMPKIEVFRRKRHQSPACIEDKNLIAFVTDDPIKVNVPTFGLDEIEKIGAFITEKFLKGFRRYN